MQQKIQLFLFQKSYINAFKNIYNDIMCMLNILRTISICCLWCKGHVTDDRQVCQL